MEREGEPRDRFGDVATRLRLYGSLPKRIRVLGESIDSGNSDRRRTIPNLLSALWTLFKEGGFS